MSHDKLSEIQAEIERQNAAFEDVKNTLGTLGDVELEVPQALLDELESLAVPTPTCITPINGVRA